MLSIGLWRWYINITIIILDVISIFAISVMFWFVWKLNMAISVTVAQYIEMRVPTFSSHQTFSRASRCEITEISPTFVATRRKQRTNEWRRRPYFGKLCYSWLARVQIIPWHTVVATSSDVTVINTIIKLSDKADILRLHNTTSLNKYLRYL
jgi:hypothetical protein